MAEIDLYNGVRSVVALLLKLAKVYEAHRSACIAFLPSDVCATLDTLVGLVGSVLAVNQPGPN